MDNESLLNEIGTLLAAIDQLNEDVPVIKKHYDELKSEIEKGTQEIASEADKQKETIAEKFSLYEELAHKSERSINTLTNRSLKQINEALEQAETTINKLEQYIVKLNHYLELLSAAEINYEEEGTIQKIYEKYNGRINGPVIVEKKGKNPWDNDYCFVIEEDAGDKYIGTVFIKGNNIRKRTYPKTDSPYSLYNGPSKKMIKEYYNNNLANLN